MNEAINIVQLAELNLLTPRQIRSLACQQHLENWQTEPIAKLTEKLAAIPGVLNRVPA